MISIIILSYRESLLKILAENISDTIGELSYELIVLDNRHNEYSLCSAYNKGIQQAKGDYYCFLHEDVQFRSKNWGNEFIEAMANNPKLGLLGILGSKFKSAFPTGWYNPVRNCSYHTGNILQGKNSFEGAVFHDFSPGSPALDKVVCLDGVLLFTKREIVEKFQFDERLLKGYHGYDIDFSLQVYFSGYDVAVLKSVKLIHYSSGNTNADWKNTNSLIANKWSKKLPAMAVNRNWINKIFRECETIYIHSSGNRLRRFASSILNLANFLLNKHLA